MPSTYAHYLFGEKVLENLDHNVREVILGNYQLFLIGLHGPDILFYYKPLKKNSIVQRGHEIHSKSVNVFLESAREKLKNLTDKDKAIAYLFGFICHFMLDSEAHPYVREITEQIHISHSELETELERLLMLKNNLDPLSFNTTSHISVEPQYADCISQFYNGISSKQILEGLKSMKIYLNLLIAPHWLKRGLITTALKISGNYESMQGLIMYDRASILDSQIVEKLIQVFEEAVLPTSHLINEFCNNLYNNKPLNKRFYRDFG